MHSFKLGILAGYRVHSEEYQMSLLYTAIILLHLIRVQFHRHLNSLHSMREMVDAYAKLLTMQDPLDGQQQLQELRERDFSVMVSDMNVILQNIFHSNGIMFERCIHHFIFLTTSLSQVVNYCTCVCAHLDLCNAASFCIKCLITTLVTHEP